MDPAILYQDDSLVIVDKPGGLLAVPGRGPDKQDCVVSRMRAQFPRMMDQPAVHRLDMQTSGIMVLAMHPAAHKSLSRQFQGRQVVKRYEAVVNGIIEKDSGVIRLAFRLDPENRPRQCHGANRGRKRHG